MNREPVTIVAYDEAWPNTFIRIRARLAPVVETDGARIEHVGSTAVPGLAAKPIVDVDVVVPSASDFETVTDRLGALGYAPEGDMGIAGRLAFAPPSGQPHHHLYVVVDGSPPHRDHVDLRDYLRSHPAEIERYAARKRELADLARNDPVMYTAAKAEIIRELLARARSPG
jgi:GrpB-like predicted nucleotidyltransferase (UPF0157 family)